MRAEPKTAIAGPSSASAPKPSTNSAWMRSTRHGSVCTQSVGPRESSSRWSVVLLVDLVAALEDRALALRPSSRSSQPGSWRSQRSMCSTGTCSSCLWASIGSPGPKLTAGTPRPLKRATSVQPNFGFTSPPTASTNALAAGTSSPGSAPGAVSVSVTSYPSKNSRTNASASASERSGAKR